MSAATGLTGLTFQLTRARFAVRQGEALLFFASVLANTISAALAFTVAGGTMMFHERWRHPAGLLAALNAEDSSFDLVLMMNLFVMNFHIFFQCPYFSFGFEL